LACGLAEGGVAEWEHAVAQLMPALMSHGLLRGPLLHAPLLRGPVPMACQMPPPTPTATACDPLTPAPALMPPADLPRSRAERTTVLAAYSLVRATRVQQQLQASAIDGTGKGEGQADDASTAGPPTISTAANPNPGPNQTLGTATRRGRSRPEELSRRESHRRQATFACGLSRWLTAALSALEEPISVAHLLGIALNASSVCPPGTTERLFLVRLHCQHRLLALQSGGCGKGMASMPTQLSKPVEPSRQAAAAYRGAAGEAAEGGVEDAKDVEDVDGLTSTTDWATTSCGPAEDKHHQVCLATLELALGGKAADGADAV